MARISITTFGGITPSVDPRKLGPEGAQRAENLDLRYGDFRPLRGAGAAVTTVPPGTISLHRTPSGTWLHATTDTDFVNGQIPDADVERVYLTGRSAYPEAWQDDEYRRLGVPAPSTAASLNVGIVFDFTPEERQAALQVIFNGILAETEAARSLALLGGGLPTATAMGSVWLVHGAATGLPTTSARQINYVVPITTGPVATVAASDGYLLEPSLNGKQVTYLASDRWAVPMSWQSTGYQIDVAPLAAYLKTIMTPPANTVRLIPDAKADEIAARIATLYSATVDPVLTLVNRINALQGEVVTQVLRSDTSSARAYALSSTIGRLNAAIAELDTYYSTLNANLSAHLNTILTDYLYLAPTPVERLIETRAYIYTYVTEWGEESAPSPASDLATLDQSDSVEVTIDAPTVAAPYGALTHWRLYRSSTTNTGAAYQFVAEVAIGTLSFTDDKAQEELQEVCPSQTWTEPRAELRGLTGGPNGIMLGFVGRTICACEPYQPYAWPREYEIPVEFDIVAIGVFGQTFVVLTTGNPYYVSGADSASLTAQKIESPQACVSKRAAKSAEGGVIYPSPDGICIAGPNGVDLTTLGAYSREDWLALGLENSFAAFSEGVYRICVEN